MKFNEHMLELSIMEMFKDEGYVHLKGNEIHREWSDVLLVDDLEKYLSQHYASVGITSEEIEIIIHRLRSFSGTLYEKNKSFMNDLTNGFILTRCDRKQKDFFVSLLDYDNPENNTFKIINQVVVQGYEQTRIPDAIVYVNGMPLVVMEFKSALRKNTTIMNAYQQLVVDYKEDIPNLFTYNAFVAISDAANSKYGSLFSPYDSFFAWRKVSDEDKSTDGISSLQTMIKGLFRKDRLLEVIRNFIFFPDQSNKELKIVCRYPQYFAATKLLINIKKHMRPNGDGKGGTYFGTTGCGKSYTMLFLTRMLMKSRFLQSPTIVLITDRTDLDDQLSDQFTASKNFIGDEKVISIDSRDKLREELMGRSSGGVYLTTIQKFSEDITLLSDRCNIICISDEAHRSQVNLEQKIRITKDGVKKGYGFAKYLHNSLPNATYVGFTGTPIDATINVFGDIVEAYTMKESVRDGITVNIVYEGRAAKVVLDNARVQEIEAYYSRCSMEGANEYQIEESKRAVAHLDAILGDPDRLRAVAGDFIQHYEKRVSEGASVAGKAIFVCANRDIAYRFYQILLELRPEWGKERIAPNGTRLTEKEKQELKPIANICLVMTRNKDDAPDLYNLLGTRDYRKELSRQFKNIKSNFKIAIVVDMWLTGFDVPFLDTMYIDKPIQQHTLIQTISRVNRVYPGKNKGLIVDYIGIKNAMNTALSSYTNLQDEEFEDIDQFVTIVRDQLEVLGQMFHRFDCKDYFTGTPKQQLFCLNRAVEFVQIAENIEHRFMTAVKQLKQAFNLCASCGEITDKEKDLIYFYLTIRSILFKLTKGDAPDIDQMNSRVQAMVEEAIQSDGIEELFETEKEIEIDLLSDEYLTKIRHIQLPNTKIKILHNLMKHAINNYGKINRIKGLEFTERLQHVVDTYNNRSGDIVFANEVLDDVAEQLIQLLHELKQDRQSFVGMGIDFEEKAFFDILDAVAKKYQFEYPRTKMIELSKKIKQIVTDKSLYTDWSTRNDIKASLAVDIILLLNKNGYPPLVFDAVYKEVLEQAENLKKYSDIHVD